MAEKKKIISLGKGGASEVNWGSIGGTLSDQTDLQNVLNTIPTATSDLENDSGYITQDDVKAYKDFPSGWHKSGTISQLISDIAADSTATEGMSYLATVSFGDLPASLIQGEMTVDIMEDDEALGKTVKFTLCSSNQSPYHWEYISAYGASGTWRSWLTEQVNADWNAASGAAQILNKPTIPTATSDLINDLGFITSVDVPEAQARANWEESDSSSPSFISNKPIVPTATSELDNDSGYITLNDVPAQVQANWEESDGASPAYIDNKPAIPTATSDLINDLGFITSVDVPEAQVQADWNEIDTTSPAYIVGKPTIPTATSELDNDSGYITLNDVPAQVQSDWNQSDTNAVDFIKNKPSIPAAQVNADWNAVSGVSQILNKPTIPAAQIQSDWNQSDNQSVDYIKNKPTIPAAQVQSDWNQSNNQSVDYIKNKPSMSTETLTFVDANNVSTTVVVYTQPQI